MADADLTQYNGTGVWVPTADVGTANDTYLVPTDLKKITAESNAAGKAPVNRSVKRAKDLLIGLRGAVIGDFIGAVKKTIFSIYVDGSGGVTHTKPSGEIVALGSITSEVGDIFATNGAMRAKNDIRSDTGTIIAAAGDVEAANNLIADSSASLCRVGPVAGQRTNQSATSLNWLSTGTGAADSNPPRGTSLKNELRAKNTQKYGGRIIKAGGAITVKEGYGNWDVSTIDLGVAFVERYRIRVTLADVLDNTNYVPKLTVFGADNANTFLPLIKTDTLTTGRFDISLWLIAVVAGAVQFTHFNVTVADFDVGFSLDGQQTT